MGGSCQEVRGRTEERVGQAERGLRHRASVSAPSPPGLAMVPSHLDSCLQEEQFSQWLVHECEKRVLAGRREKRGTWPPLPPWSVVRPTTAGLKHPLNEGIRNGGRPRKKGPVGGGGGGVSCRGCFYFVNSSTSFSTS